MRTITDSLPGAPRSGDIVYNEICGAAVEDLPALVLDRCRFEVVQLKQGKSCCDADFVACSQAVICRKRISCPLHLRGSMSGGSVALGLVYGDTPDAVAGYTARDDLLFVALAGTPFDLFLRGGQTLLLVMASQNALVDLAHQASAGEAVKAVMGSGNTLSVLRAGGKAVSEARNALLDLIDGARRGDLGHNGAELGGLVREAMVMLLDCAEEGEGRGSAEILVRRAREIVGDHPRRFSVSKLSGELRVSPRTLHKAFFEVTGVGPHAYFLRQRLNAARHRLAAADGQHETVTNIALELGFTELGRFAGRYRAFFGENPSQTLQRPRRCIEPVPA